MLLAIARHHPVAVAVAGKTVHHAATTAQSCISHCLCVYVTICHPFVAHCLLGCDDHVARQLPNDAIAFDVAS